MAGREVGELLEELAQAVLLADAEAPPSAQLTELLEELVRTWPRGEDAPLLETAGEIRALLREVGRGGDGPRALVALSHLVAELQRRLPSASGARDLAVSSSPPESGGAVRRDADTLELLGDFVQEVADTLAKVDELLLAGERDGFDEEAVHTLFRAFHSVKGLSAHLPEVAEMTRLSHETESLLDLVRSRQLALEGEALEAVFESGATLREALGALREAVDREAAVPPIAGLAPLLERLRRAAQGPVAGSQAGPSRASVSAPGAARVRESLRVDPERLDAIVEMAGELVIVEAMLAHAPEAARGSERLTSALSQLRRVSRDLQGAAMRMRMVPLRALFKRMQRLVRELGLMAGKEVALRVSGEATEMDRAVVDALEEPLVHLLRNAIDHGIEAPAERQRAGKPPCAAIALQALHQGGKVVVEVSDDGRGLQREAILAKARALGLVAASEAPSPEEVEALIFAPGFSTAARVTELSGRGVGLDAVSKAVAALRGSVRVSSEPGAGAKFRLELPLTLAVIDGLLLRCGEERYLAPSLAVLESLQVAEGMICRPADREELLRVRGEVLPLIRLGRLFGGGEGQSGRSVAVLVQSAGRRAALLVDAVLSQQQVVIKPLSEGVGRAELFSGASILSDGRVGLILDVDRICATQARRERQLRNEEVSK